MSRDKQIKGMARVLCDAHEPCSKCVWGRCDVENSATRLYNAGYCKASEIIAEIEKLMRKRESPITTMAFIETKEYKEFKRQYTEEI